ncbi:MAG TPA: tetratricopeptide repeat protein [Pyrinomonadaceae bacterium]|nr:tetratricopeptide repeat protein [Pyrinomonadaceae bacterium]
MKELRSFVIGFVGVCGALGIADAAYAQTTTTDLPSVAATPPQTEERSAREQALTKLFEGQRHMWQAQRLRTQAGRLNAYRLAQSAFENAVAVDPTLAEAFTALAELAVTLPPGNIDTAIEFARSAVKLNPQNYGGQRMLARLCTIKSRLNNGKLDEEFADRAAAAWKDVVRLDPRNAEGWAFIAAFAEAKGRVPEQIDALKKWVSSTSPADVQFYARVMKGAGLTAESATLKLAETLSGSGKSGEAISVLVDLITDGGDNSEAVSLLSRIVDSVEGDASVAALTALQQAESVNADNIQLTNILARLYSRLERNSEAIAAVDRRSASLMSTDRRGASMLYVSLSDLYLESDRYDPAFAALEKALSVRGIQQGGKLADEDREFATFIFEKLIHLGKVSDRLAVARKYIERARKVFGNEDPFADRQMVSLLQAFGLRKEALAIVRSFRKLRPTDNSLLRSEATILAGLGQIDEAVALFKERKAVPVAPSTASTGPVATAAVRVPTSDEFSDLFFIAGLYLKAGLSREAISAAAAALVAARGTERKQLAKVALADANRLNGDRTAAEKLLRDVLSEMPRSPIALNSLGSLLAEKEGGLDEAVELIRKALAIDQKNASYLNSLGMVLLKLGEISDAEKYLRSAARLDAGSSSIYENLGDLYEEKNDTQAAKTAWRRALRVAYSQAETDRIRKKLGN